MGRVLTLRIGVSVILLVAVLWLSGCGFQLRGYDTLGEVHFKTALLTFSSDVRPEVQFALRKQLERSGVHLVDSEKEAEIWIQLPPTQYKVSRTAFSGQGDATAELLSMSQPFVVTWVLSGNHLVKGRVETYRDRQIDTAALLASEQELVSIRENMADDLARSIMDRINRAVQKQFSLSEVVTP